jgi:hypothetical protein
MCGVFGRFGIVCLDVDCCRALCGEERIATRAG